ncbi:MAG: sigma factor-like helix-turn-helix DNA-binding protein [Clostridium perfringens]|nr:sigma factor-like helix-turn-helix DNA-binding protein [Clostridium perfringens]MDU4828467.1 sigma factor-like helix-turn-helix DNA-binding protein [Clostridium perfringens]
MFFQGKTQNEAAKLLGTNQVQISRIKNRAIESLRKILVC